MYTAEDYLQGWIAYSIGGLFLLFFLWYLLRNIRYSAVRHIFMLSSAVVLFTPVTAYRDDAHLAPAFFVSLYEGVLLSGANDGFQRGLAPIIAVLIFALLIYALGRFLWAKVFVAKVPVPRGAMIRDGGDKVADPQAQSDT
ncbi:hypothetical protein OAD77_05275 [Porticoccaceae bacterium]|nr:hypothetical protein [Porticoccaceae bacterium]MDB9970164.1 hypothetical protein [Porticoccaceae bacterium]MDC0011521.1 hypothetical protein [Porticoccaceae bacterium]